MMSETQNTSYHYDIPAESDGPDLFSRLIDKGIQLLESGLTFLFGSPGEPAQAEQHRNYSREYVSSHTSATFIDSATFVEPVTVELRDTNGTHYGTLRGTRSESFGADGTKQTEWKFSEAEQQKFYQARQQWREDTGRGSCHAHHVVAEEHPWKLRRLAFTQQGIEALKSSPSGNVVTQYAADGHSYSQEEISARQDFADRYLSGAKVIAAQGPGPDGNPQIGVVYVGVTTGQYDQAMLQYAADKQHAQQQEVSRETAPVVKQPARETTVSHTAPENVSFEYTLTAAKEATAGVRGMVHSYTSPVESQSVTSTASSGIINAQQLANEVKSSSSGTISAASQTGGTAYTYTLKTSSPSAAVQNR